MEVREAVEAYLLAKQFHRDKTKRAYRYRLKPFADWCEKNNYQLEQVKPPVVRLYVSKFIGKSDYTLKGHTRDIKTFLKWCSLEEEFEAYVSEKAWTRIEIPKVEEDIITVFTPDEIKRLFAACDKGESLKVQVRDKAILSVLFDTGIRASELVYDPSRPHERTGLRMDNVFISPHLSYIRVYGKGKKVREVGMGGKAKVALRRYIKDYRDNSPSPYVFLSRDGEPLALRSLQSLLERIGERARVEDCHPHKFRHTSACMYLLNGGDLYTLSRRMGHSQIATTELYLRAIKDRQARQGLSVLDNLK